MRYSSKIYKQIIEKLINNYGSQVFIGLQEDIKTQTAYIESLFKIKTIDNFEISVIRTIDFDYENTKKENKINYALKFIDFQHLYVAIKALEQKYSSFELERTLNKIRQKLDSYCLIMAENLEDFEI